MKQTAVEYLSEQIRLTNIEGLREQLWGAIEQAKEMEKQQIIDARATSPLLDTGSKNEYIIEAKQYYNETFNK